MSGEKAGHLGAHGRFDHVPDHRTENGIEAVQAGDLSLELLPGQCITVDQHENLLGLSPRSGGLHRFRYRPTFGGLRHVLPTVGCSLLHRHSTFLISIIPAKAACLIRYRLRLWQLEVYLSMRAARTGRSVHIESLSIFLDNMTVRLLEVSLTPGSISLHTAQCSDNTLAIPAYRAWTSLRPTSWTGWNWNGSTDTCFSQP